MKKDEKILVIAQIIVSICFILYWIKEPINNLFVNQTTGEPLFTPIVSFIYFNFLLYIFGLIWSASLIVLIIETYMSFLYFKNSSIKIFEEYEQNIKISFYIGYISVLIILLTWI